MEKFIDWVNKIQSDEILATPQVKQVTNLRQDFINNKIDEGLEQEKQNNLTQAIICYVEVLNIDFNCALAHEALARVFTKQGKFEDAKFHFDRAAELNSGAIANKNSNSDITNEKPIENQSFSLNENISSFEGQIDEKSEYIFTNTVSSLAYRTDLAQQQSDRVNQIVKHNDDKDIALSNVNHLWIDIDKELETRKSWQNRNEKAGTVLLEQALLFYEDKQWSSAIASCQKVLEKYGESAQAHKIWGNCLQQQGLSGEAIEHYALAIEIDPNLVEVYVNLGTIFIKRNNWNKALDYYTQAVNIDPYCAGVHRNLARLWSQLNNLDKAEEHLFQAINLEPRILSAEQHLELATELIEEGKEAMAISCCCHAIKLKPEFRSAYIQLINILETSQKWPEAIPYYQQLSKLTDEIAWKKNRSSARVNNLLSSIAKKGSTASFDAKSSLKQNQIRPGVSLQLPTSTQTLINSRSKNSQQTPLEADSVEALLLTGNKFALEQQWQEAIYCYQKAIEQKPDNAIAYHNLAKIYREINDTEAFITCTYRFFVLKPRSVSVKNHFVLGNLLLDRSKIAEATVCFRQALEIEPEFTQARDKLREISAIYRHRDS